MWVVLFDFDLSIMRGRSRTRHGTGSQWTRTDRQDAKPEYKNKHSRGPFLTPPPPVVSLYMANNGECEEQGEAEFVTCQATYLLLNTRPEIEKPSHQFPPHGTIAPYFLLPFVGDD